MGEYKKEQKTEKKDKRKMIIDKSMELFRENGYFETKVDDITKSLGISKGNFYTYFKTKEEVLYKILEILKEEKIKAMEEINTEKSPKEVLRDFITKRSEIFFKYMKNINLQNMDRFLKDKKVVEYMEEIYNISMDFLQKNVTKRCGIVKNKKCNDSFITKFILSSIEGIFIDEGLAENTNKEKEKDITREEKIRWMVEFIYNGLKES